MIRTAMERLGIPVIGAIRRDERMHSPERHLGLTPVTETDPQSALTTIREAVKVSVDLDALANLATAAPTLIVPELTAKEVTGPKARIGVAYDEAFSFYYPASLQALAAEGADLVYFSPLTDKTLPDVDALLFGGGFPEMFLETLSENTGSWRLYGMQPLTVCRFTRSAVVSCIFASRLPILKILPVLWLALCRLRQSCRLNYKKLAM